MQLNYIANTSVASSSGKTIPVIDPSDGQVFDEIQRSNMSKLGEDGNPIYREDGKVMKGPNYFKPNFEEILK